MFSKYIQKIMKNKIMFSGGIYLFFSLLTQLVNLLYTPLFTRNLSQSDYGVYNLLTSIEGVLAIFFLLALPSGYSRFYNEKENKIELENSILSFLIILGCFVLIGIIIFSDLISSVIFKNIENGSFYVILIAFIAYFSGLVSLLIIKYSMEFKALKVSSIEIGKIILQYILMIFILNNNKFSIKNILLLRLIVVIGIFIILFLPKLKDYKFQINIKKIRPSLVFGLGMMLGQFSTWILTLIDRYFLSSYYGFDEVGIYSLAYKIGMLINPIFINPFKKIFTPLKFKVYSRENGKKILESYYNLYSFAGIFILLAISVYSKIGVFILSTEGYSKAITIVPIICISYFFWGLNEFYSLGIVLGNKSSLNSVIATMAAVINIIINILLIPKIGMYGAALSTVISYLVTNKLYYHFGKKYYFIKLNCLCWIKYFILFLINYIVYLYFYKTFTISLVQEIFINFLFLINYIILSFIFKFITLEEIKETLKNDI